MHIKTTRNDKVYLSIDFEDFSHDFKRGLGLTKDNKINENEKQEMSRPSSVHMQCY